MKKILTAILCTVPLLMFSQNKVVEVTYVKAIKKVTDKSIKAPRIIKDLSYVLIADKKEAKFSFNEKMSLDGVERSNKRFIGRGGGKGIYYKNIKKKIKYNQSEYNDVLYLKEDRKYKWKLTKEKKEISGYQCYKATAKFIEYNPFVKKNVEFEIIVWYTPQIPYSFGPAGYDGLPGLVLTAQRGGFYFIAQNIRFLDVSKKTKSRLKEPTKGIKVTQKEFNEIIYKNFKKNYEKRKG